MGKTCFHLPVWAVKSVHLGDLQFPKVERIQKWPCRGGDFSSFELLVVQTRDHSGSGCISILLYSCWMLISNRALYSAAQLFNSSS